MPRLSKFSHRFLFAFALCSIALFSVGCGSKGSSSTSSNARIRFVNTSPDQLSVNVLIDGKSVAMALPNGGQATAYLAVASGARRIQIQNPTSLQFLLDTTPTIAAGDSTYFIADLAVALRSVILTDDNTAPTMTTGNFKMRVVNLAPKVNNNTDAFIELSTVGTLNGLTPTFPGLQYPTASSYYTNTAGSWEVVFTPPGQTAPPFYGTPIALTLAAGQIDTVMLVQNDDQGDIKAIVTLVDVQ